METRSKSFAPCAAVWSTGIPLKATPDGFPIVMKPSQNCQVTVKGTKDIAYVGLPGSNVKDQTKEQKATFLAQVRAYLDTIPRLSLDDLDSAPEGVYTWLLWSKDGSSPQFVASKTETMLELGTTHYSIATSIGASRVHGAGELWKHGGELTVNFLSGTFMQSWVLPKDCPLAAMQQYIKRKLQTEVLPDLFRGKTLSFSDTTFIAPRFLEGALTTAELESYVAAGFVVCIYNEGAWEECKSTKAMCKKPMTLEAMKGGDDLTLQGQRVPLTPRKAYLNRPSMEEGGLGQAAKARLVFASQGLLAAPRTQKEQALASLKRPISPASVGLGRKTRKAKKARRKTRRRV